jgi:succinoglycan biosynthesis transport protein ExoP
MAVTDAALVAHRASGVVFVVGSEMTNRNAAMQAVEQLGSARAKFMGAVLNRVNVERNSYYYSRYYRREYSNYYNENSGAQP